MAQDQPQIDSGAAHAAFVTGGAESCLVCHGADRFYPAAGILQTAHARVANPRSPFAEGKHQCQSCHGPSANHLSVGADGRRPPPPVAFNAGEDPEAKNTVCLDCHRGDVGPHWAGSIHQFEEVACSDCHQLHDPRDPVTQRATQSDLCLDCHRPQRADFLRRSAHPVREGLQVCADCHEPHGSAGPALLATTTVNDTCYNCHAEKRGPFLWEHASVREDCTNCHVPHGSNHQALLQARTPWLCQQCHLVQFHPSTSLDGTARLPQGSNHLLLGKDCMNCHVQVHGSNHPSGPGLVR
ncbi:MAG: DmsE family decaheme c-type cytochrome [Cellvibrionaceae bacterium]